MIVEFEFDLNVFNKLHFTLNLVLLSLIF